MGKKALQLASVASMIDQFNIPNIQILQSLGYEVDVIADFTNPGTITAERSQNLRMRLAEMGVRVFDVAIPRSLNPIAIAKAYKQVKKLVSTERYSIVHCHSPIGGVICRQAAKKERGKDANIIYTAHGFHFYSGAPLKNWMIFYPIEKHFSRHTDVLITINQEDYRRAKEKFHAKRTIYIPGVGINTAKFTPKQSGREKIRKELGLIDEQVLLLSVGELNDNKNHIAVIRALKDMDLTYVIVGKGDRESMLQAEAKALGVDVRLVGFRNDVADFYNAADVYVLPSIREGLNVSLMEAMSSGLSVACSRIRGNTDLIYEEGCLFKAEDIDSIRRAIGVAIKDKANLGRRNRIKIQEYDCKNVNNIMSKVYQQMTEE